MRRPNQEESTGASMKVTQLLKLASEGSWRPKGEEFFFSGQTPDDGRLFQKHEEKIGTWIQREASVRNIIYETVDNATFLKTKDQTTAADETQVYPRQ